MGGVDPRDLVRRALAREAASVRVLIDLLSPVIQRSVAAVLRRQSSRRDSRQEVMDMTNEVFAALFQADGKALRAWDPARGCTLESFVSLLARHQAFSILRNGKASPWPDEPTDDEQLEALCHTSMSVEEIVSSREHLHLLLDRVRQELSPIDQELFQCLILEDQPVDQVAARFKKNVPAIYQWRHRLLENLRKWSGEILETSKSRQALDGDTNRRREKGSGGQ